MRLICLMVVLYCALVQSSVAQIICTPLSSTVFFPLLDPRISTNVFMSSIQVSCENHGSESSAQWISISIDDPDSRAVNSLRNVEIPVKVRLRNDRQSTNSTMCRHVELASGVNRVFDIPIWIYLLTIEPSHGLYKADIPISVLNIQLDMLENHSCN